MNEIEQFLIGGFVLFTILSFTIVLFFLAYRNKQRHHQTEKNLLENQYQKTLLETKLEVSEQTMKQIAQEIHDNIGQRITLAIQAIDYGSDTDVKGLLSGALKDLRDLSKSLHTSYIVEMGLDLAIEKECEIVCKSSNINCVYTPEEIPPKLTTETELILYRCLQEILSNAIKHSKASEILISLCNRGCITELAVKDNGKGFNTHSENRGVGINSLEERVNLLRGELNISSIIGSGTEVVISVPQSIDNQV